MCEEPAGLSEMAGSSSLDSLFLPSGLSYNWNSDCKPCSVMLLKRGSISGRWAVGRLLKAFTNPVPSISLLSCRSNPRIVCFGCSVEVVWVHMIRWNHPNAFPYLFGDGMWWELWVRSIEHFFNELWRRQQYMIVGLCCNSKSTSRCLKDALRIMKGLQVGCSPVDDSWPIVDISILWKADILSPFPLNMLSLVSENNTGSANLNVVPRYQYVMWQDSPSDKRDCHDYGDFFHAELFNFAWKVAKSTGG